MPSTSFIKYLLLIEFYLSTVIVDAQSSKGFAVLVGVPTTKAQCVRDKTFDNKATIGVPADLANMHEVVRRAGIEPSHVTSLSTAAQTTPTAILAALRSIKPKPGDLIFFYFSGHGDQIEDTNGDEDDCLDEVLAGSNRCLVDDDLRPIWVSYGPQVRIVMIVDACHAGSTFSIQDFAISVRPASLWPSRRKSVRAHVTPSSHSAEKEARYKRERSFERSRTLLGSCVDERVQHNEPYQMIYISASRDPTTAIGDDFGGHFTRNLSNLILSDNPNNPSGRTYRQLCLDVPSCPTIGTGGISYAEIGAVTEAFRNSAFLQITP